MVRLSSKGWRFSGSFPNSKLKIKSDCFFNGFILDQQAQGVRLHVYEGRSLFFARPTDFNIFYYESKEGIELSFSYFNKQGVLSKAIFKAYKLVI